MHKAAPCPPIFCSVPPALTSPVASDSHAGVAPGDIAVGVVIGRASEYFDFFVYAIASVLVFPAVFFPFVSRLEGMLYAFMLFSFAFIAKPLGTLAFMAIQRRVSREAKLGLALFLLGTCTAGIAFLPSYGDLGSAAIVMLAVLRIGQGIALGGSWDGLPSLLALNAPANRRGWYAMLGQLGAPVGFLVAAGLFACLLFNLSSDDFLAWGWRYPFYVAFAINVVALFARLQLVASREYASLLDERELQPVRVRELARQHGRNVIIGALAALASFALFHMVTVFPLSWIALYSERPAGEILLVQMGGAALAALGMVASGWIADRIGRRTTLGSLAGLIALFSMAVPMLLDGGARGQDIFILAGFALLGSVLRPGFRHRDGEFPGQLPLYRRRADFGPGLAGRRRLRTAGGAGTIGQVRPDRGQPLPAVRRSGDAAGAGPEPRPGTQRVSRYASAARAGTRRPACQGWTARRNCCANAALVSAWRVSSSLASDCWACRTRSG